VDAITQTIEILKQSGIECELKIEGPNPKFDMAVESNVYWIAQEMLSNIRKHANASHVSVCLQNGEDWFTIVVEDNGQGFDPGEIMNSNLTLERVGMMGMKERADLLGAKLTITSTKGKGTTGCLKLPSNMENLEGGTNGEKY
jgi:two-component system nitrate/nitrite sensor histidine kinase NarX